MYQGLGVIGTKCGMTRLFQPDGSSIPVSVVAISKHYITQIKVAAGSDSYNAIQVTTGTKKAKKLTKAEQGHFAKAAVEPGRLLKEFRVNDAIIAEYKIGDALDLSKVITLGQIVDVVGTSRGKGFAGVIKRWNFSSQRMTHGNSLSHRAPGSIGQCQDPGRVFKGKKMSGHMGNAQVTARSLEIMQLDLEKGVVLIKGAIPGAPGGDVILQAAVAA
ncbi:MAG: 50S ribosomal protein L3 [Legionellales bacterium]|nr:MAG: 50S ribosomal protein L3 [Legionellales bacterium]